MPGAVGGDTFLSAAGGRLMYNSCNYFTDYRTVPTVPACAPTAPSMQVMTECLEDYLRCNEQDRAVDPVSLQGEVLALKARLREAERQIR